MQKLKKLFYSALTCTFLLNINMPANSTEKEVKVYSGRHYNTDRSVYKKFAEETGIKVRLIEAAGISLIERLKREGKNSQADLILLISTTFELAIITLTLLVNAYHSLFGSFNPTGTSFSKFEDSIA